MTSIQSVADAKHKSCKNYFNMRCAGLPFSGSITQRLHCRLVKASSVLSIN